MSAGNGLRRRCIYCGASGPVKATECPRCRGAGLYRQTTDLMGAAAVETPGGQLIAALDPLQVARAVLIDATRDPDTARRWAASYANVTGDPTAWPIPTVAVRAWVRAMEADLSTVTPDELATAAEAWDRATMEGGAE